MKTQDQLDREWFERTIAIDTQAGASYDQVTAEIQAISDWYDKTPSIINEQTVTMYHCFSNECHDQAKWLTKKHNVKIELVTGQPYLTLEEMSADIRQGILKITTDNTNHPIMFLEDTIALRIWHDLTHYEIQANFGFYGEVRTYEAQCLHVETSWRNQVYLQHVLYCDIVGQVANGLVHRVFPEQKVFTLYSRSN